MAERIEELEGLLDEAREGGYRLEGKERIEGMKHDEFGSKFGAVSGGLVGFGWGIGMGSVAAALVLALGCAGAGALIGNLSDCLEHFTLLQ